MDLTIFVYDPHLRINVHAGCPHVMPTAVKVGGGVIVKFDLQPTESSPTKLFVKIELARAPNCRERALQSIAVSASGRLLDRLTPDEGLRQPGGQEGAELQESRGAIDGSVRIRGSSTG